MKDSTLAKYKLVIDQWFINGFNGSAAYQTIYPKSKPDSAKSEFVRIFTIPNVQDYVQTKQNSQVESSGITHTELIENLKEIRDRCMQGTPVKDKDGSPTGEWKFDANAAIKAIENLGKHIGFYDNDNSGGATIIVEQIKGMTIKK